MMKPIPGLDAVLERARGHGVFGTKMRSVVLTADKDGVDAVADQQFDLARQILAAGLVPIIEPEVDIKSPQKAEAEKLLKTGILQHLNALYNFAMYLTRNPPEAEDLVQETYLRAFRFSHRFQPGTHLRAWLFQILRNTFLTFYRLREREAAVAEDGVPDWDTPMFHDTPLDEGRAMEAHTDLERALRRLPEEFRTVLLLAEVEGMPLEEVARVMACPVGTVKSRIFRAKERLRGLLKDYEK